MNSALQLTRPSLTLGISQLNAKEVALRDGAVHADGRITSAPPSALGPRAGRASAAPRSPSDGIGESMFPGCFRPIAQTLTNSPPATRVTRHLVERVILRAAASLAGAERDAVMPSATIHWRFL
jgi:hypothetical protein